MIATKLNPLEVSLPTRPAPIRVAVVCDFTEERWPSMDLVGNMLHATLVKESADRIEARLIRPKMPFASTDPGRISRLWGRFVHYPREVRRIRPRFDVFHITDHSYAHLVHELPAEQTVVTCHDIDAFRCLIDPGARRSPIFRALAQRVLTGMQRSAHVACASEATRQQILANRLLPPEKLSVVHNGVHPALTAEPNLVADAQLSALIGREPGDCIELIHVGSTIPRKRIDVLLRVFAAVRQHRKEVRLLRIGGEFTAPQRRLAESLEVLPHVDVLPPVGETLLAAAYRRASVLLQTSESEGFGLPVIEAMACGTPVVATDIAPLREGGGSAAEYCSLGDTPMFTRTVLHLLSEREVAPSAWQIRCSKSLAQARQFTWTAYTSKMAAIYARVLNR